MNELGGVQGGFVRKRTGPDLVQGRHVSCQYPCRKTQLSRLVEQAAGGEEIIIARAGRPLAKLVPLTAPASGRKRVLGVLAGQLRAPDDFQAPLPDEMLAAFEGR